LEKKMKRRLRLTGSATGLPIREHGEGYLAEGPGFYIWDENLDEVIRTARLLERGASRRAASATRVQLARDYRSGESVVPGVVTLHTEGL
jgi:hypothetical protein